MRSSQTVLMISKVILSVSTKEASLIHGFRRNINGQSERDLLRSISV